MKIDKSSWLTVHFDDIAMLVSETSKDPESEGLEKYVGLEHLTPKDIRITSWGNVSEGTTFTRKFQSGDVLFGRRRAYQKKAALAEFSGVCSGDILVFRAKADVILPELLPFVVQNDIFFEQAVKTSAGSLSPRTKFKDLAPLQITIPPKDKQESILRLFKKADDYIEKGKDMSASILQMVSSVLNERSGGIDSANRTRFSALVKDKPQYGANEKAISYTHGPRYIRITDIDQNGNLREDSQVGINTESYEKYILHHNDLLLARSADPGRSFLFDRKYGDCVFAGYLIRFVLDETKVDPRYVYLFTMTDSYWNQIKRLNKKGTLSNINAQQYLSLELNVPDLNTQQKIIEEIDAILSIDRNIQSQMNKFKSSMNEIGKLVFGDSQSE